MNEIFAQNDILEKPVGVNLPNPNFSVCGADVNEKAYWNEINKLFNELYDDADESSSRIINRYFGTPLTGLSDIVPPSSTLATKVCTIKPKCGECPLKYHCEYFRQKETVPQAVTFADFFAGAGGLSLGFEKAGLYPALANDIDPWFMATYKYNRPSYTTEISACDIQTWLSRYEYRQDWNIDIVSGGVPCQSFSMANRQRKEDDPRDKLYSALMKAAGLIKPKVILIENVSGMIKEFDGVQSDLAMLGYSSDHIIINTKDYGIPQSRRRLFFIAFSKSYYSDSENRVRKVIDNIIACKLNKEVTLYDAISDLTRLDAHIERNATNFNNDKSGRSVIFHDLTKASDYVRSINENKAYTPVFNHKARYNNLRDVKIFNTLKQGENSLAESIKDIMPYSGRNNIFKDKYYKLRYDTYCKTITAHMRYDCNMYIHPEQARGLTAREAARVQSFPDDYVFLGNFQRLYQQVGNAVPPRLAQILGNAIKENI